MRKNKTIMVPFALLSIFALLVPRAFATTPIVQQVTGGGWILARATRYGEEISRKTFSFNVEELEDGTLRGNVEYLDHGAWADYEKGYPRVQGYEITGLVIDGKNHAWIDGICRLSGNDTPREFFVHVVDEDELGKHDWFEISIPSIGYWAGAELGFPEDAGGGGNIQIHRPTLWVTVTMLPVTNGHLQAFDQYGTVYAGPGSHDIPIGYIIYFEAIPDPGYVCSQWFVNGEFYDYGITNLLQIQISEPITVLAVFAKSSAP